MSKNSVEQLVKRWQFWLGVTVSVVFVIVAVRGLKLELVWDYLRTANYAWLIPGIIIYFFAVWARTWRWHYLLNPIKVIPLRRLFPVVAIGYMGNNIYPIRAGEFIRAYVLKRGEDVPMSASLATIFIERIFDGLVMLLFVFVALPFTPIPPAFRQLVVLFSVLFFFALGFFMAVAANPLRARRFYDFFVNRFLPATWQDRMGGLFDRFLSGLGALRSPRDMLMVFVTSIVIWLAETVKYWFVMHAFDFSVSFMVLMLMNGIVNLATTLPAAPGYIGTFDLPGIAVLKAFGVSPEVAVGYTLVLHAALWLPITLVGAYFMWREQLSWRDLGRATAPRQELEPL